MIDKSRVAQRFKQALQTYDNHAYAQQQINRLLLQILLDSGTRKFRHVLEIGCGTGDFSQLLIKHLQVDYWSFNDLCDVSGRLECLFPNNDFTFYLGDGENYSFPERYDLIASASTVQWFNDPQSFINKCVSLLNAKGWLLIGTFSPENLHEIYHLTNVGLHYPDLKNWQQWLNKDFHIHCLFQREIPLYFSTPVDVLKHLKATGVTGTGKGSWTKGQLKQFVRDYQQQYQNKEGKVQLTYSPLFILAQKRS